MTNQLQLVDFWVLLEVFHEAEIAARVKNESKGVVWRRVDSEEPDNVGVRKLCEHPQLAEEPLKQNVNHAVRKKVRFSPEIHSQRHRFRNIYRTFGRYWWRREYLARCLQNRWRRWACHRPPSSLPVRMNDRWGGGANRIVELPPSNVRMASRCRLPGLVGN